jgi:hypothetical protein
MSYARMKKFKFLIWLTGGNVEPTIEYGADKHVAMRALARTLKDDEKHYHYYITKPHGIMVNPIHVIKIERGQDVEK